jgi:hypothetical protein
MGCLFAPLSGFPQKSAFLLKNDQKMSRTGEPVVLKRMDFEKWFGPGKPNEVPVIKLASGKLIATQADDSDGDGKWDELAFVVDIDASCSLKIEAFWMAKELAPVFEKKTQVYLGQANIDGSFTEVTRADAPLGPDGFPAKYQSEGVGWENDKMAFRVYFDCRNTKDLFGKLKPGLILKKAGTPESGDYHNLAPWGMDILHCGSSLGAGGLAMAEGDSLFRLGSTPVYQYVKIAEGPVRTIFELRYKGWEVMGHEYEAVERITLWIGKYWFQSEVRVKEFSGEKQVATGIVTSRLKTEPISFQANGNFTAILTHDTQSLNNDVLAMAVLAPTNEVAKIARTSNTDFYRLGYQTVPVKSFSHIISETYYLTQKIKSDSPSVHYFFAWWGLENPAWNDVENVKVYVRNEAEKLSRPLTIGW